MPNQYPNPSNEPTQVSADEIALNSSVSIKPPDSASFNQEPQNNINTTSFPPQNSDSNGNNSIKNKKSHTKTIVASILGILLLAGGVGAGTFLVKQRQDIREKAALPTCEQEGGKCVPESYYCTEGSTSEFRCPTGKKCGFGDCSLPKSTPSPIKTTEPKPEPTNPPSLCNRVPTNQIRKEWGNTLTITQEDINKCKAACPDGVIWVSKYKCDGINLSQGCQDNGTVLTWNAKAGDSFSVGTLDCGTVQIDAGCKNSANTYGNVAYLSTSANVPCNTPAPTNPPIEETTQCLNLKVYDTNWNIIPNNLLSQLKPGDKIRFAASGSPANKIDKAKFTINGVETLEISNKKPGSDEFYTEYEIPSGVRSFTVTVKLHHITLGWF
ncbi:MAG: hypothetical protein KatS3mg088_725 [Patescibacteria group bacterium]|nr:MAG: hypothetical protein KatS3mg088_725 [Patescibacteria group bacterium]